MQLQRLMLQTAPALLLGLWCGASAAAAEPETPEVEDAGRAREALAKAFGEGDVTLMRLGLTALRSEVQTRELRSMVVENARYDAALEETEHTKLDVWALAAHAAIGDKFALERLKSWAMADLEAPLERVQNEVHGRTYATQRIHTRPFQVRMQRQGGGLVALAFLAGRGDLDETLEVPGAEEIAARAEKLLMDTMSKWLSGEVNAGEATMMRRLLFDGVYRALVLAKGDEGRQLVKDLIKNKGTFIAQRLQLLELLLFDLRESDPEDMETWREYQQQVVFDWIRNADIEELKRNYMMMVQNLSQLPISREGLDLMRLVQEKLKDDKMAGSRLKHYVRGYEMRLRSRLQRERIQKKTPPEPDKPENF